MQNERANHTLTPTALVHEAYLRLVGDEPLEDNVNSRRQFFAAAAVTMRRILVDSARRKKAQKRGGGDIVLQLDEELAGGEKASRDIEALDAALSQLEEKYPDLAELVMLRYFAGMTMAQAAESLETPLRTTERNWRFARAWLREALNDDA